MKKIAIVGAGPAGLTAAYLLLKYSKEYEVIVYEKSQTIGGLSCTYKFNGNRVDIGGHRFLTKSDRIFQLWQDILPIGKGKLLIKKRTSHILFDGKLYPYPLKVNRHLLKQLGIKESIKVALAYLKARVENSNIDNLEDFYVKRFGRELYTLFFEKYTEKLWGIPAKKLSADWGTQRIQKLSLKSLINANNKDRTFTEQFYYPAYGAGQMWEQLGKMIVKMGGKIIFDAHVKGYEYEEKNIHTVIYESEKTEYKVDVDYVISSATLRETAINLSAFNEKNYIIAKRLKYRNMVIAAVYIEKTYMETLYKQLSNDMWIYIQDFKIPFGRIQILNNWSENMVNDNTGVLLEVEYYCDITDPIWNATDMEIIEKSKNGLNEINLISKNAPIISYFVKRIENAYPIYTEGYDNIKEIKEWINSYNNLYCVGRNGQHCYNNMDHSMETAFEAVDILTGRKTDKEQIWDINSNDEYIEKMA